MEKNKLTIFWKEEASEICDEIDIITKKHLKKEIHDALDKRIDALLDKIPMTYDKKSGTLLKTGMETVSFRTKTFGLLLDALTANYKKDTYENILRTVGELTGSSFSLDLFHYLRKIQKIPKDYEALLHFWAGYDSSAGFGIIEIKDFSEDDKYIDINVSNSYLVRSQKEKEKENWHKYCSYLEGYIYGTLYESLSELYHLLDETEIYRPPNNLLKPILPIQDKPKDTICQFRVNIDIEKLTHASKQLYKAKKGYRDRSYIEGASSARTVFEYSLKELFDIPLEDPTSFYRLRRGFFDYCPSKDIKVKLKHYDSAYAKASEILHKDREASPELCNEILEKAMGFLRDVSNSEMTRGQKSDAIEFITKKPESKTEQSQELQHLQALTKIHTENLRKYQKEKKVCSDDLLPDIERKIEEEKDQIKKLQDRIDKFKKD